MSQNDELRDLYELYALGLLEEPERSQIQEAIRGGEFESRAMLGQALANNAVIMAAAPAVEPPARLRAKILSAAGEASAAPVKQRAGWWSWAWASVAAAGLVAVVVLGNQLLTRNDELASVQRDLQRVALESARTNGELAKAKQILSILNAPETRFVTFGPVDPKPPRGKVLVNPSRGVILLAANLPAAPSGKIYEMWLVPTKGGKPVPAGLFQTDAAGAAMHFHESVVSADTAVAVTLEPAGGSDQPTSTPLFVAAL